ncbi:MAG TPA: DNA-3-methyladenine glycosylase [Solirubrobacterales bacterium]|jgi:DNA-3-methyladenine glycosylase|nr:DNA-3-methyladenine glycosylase [Solirubrobacterales bacterium]
MPSIPANGKASGDGGRLGVDFFERSVHSVAPELIGCRLLFGGVGGVIVEVEAYEREDPASHSYVGLTERTKVMFGPPARAYVYLSYGIHSLLNFVCEPEGDAAAVLLRALEPTAGLEQMRTRRQKARADLDLCSGPGKLTEALGVTLAQNAARLDQDPFLLLPPAGDPPEVVASPRIGITKAVEKPWRFSAAGSRYVSRPRPG